MIYSTVHIIIYKLCNITCVSNRTISYIRFVVNGSFTGHFTEHTIKDVRILALRNTIQLCSTSVLISTKSTTLHTATHNKYT